MVHIPFLTQMKGTVLQSFHLNTTLSELVLLKLPPPESLLDFPFHRHPQVVFGATNENEIVDVTGYDSPH